MSEPAPVRFTPCPILSSTPLRSDESSVAEESAEAPSGPEPVDLEALRAEAYEEGRQAGLRAADEAMAEERLALARLAASLETLRPEPVAPLAALLAETVERLVRQIVGEVETDPVLLAERAGRAAALVAEESEAAVLLAHPADLPLIEPAGLAIRLAPDPELARGTLVVHCGSGWIEDGPAIRLDRLRAALDRLGAPE